MSTLSQPCGAASPAAAEAISDIIQRAALAQAAYVAAELRLADHLARGPMRADALARATGAHAPSLARLMRALVTLGLCIERDDGTFALTEAGSLLRVDADRSLQSWLLWFGRNQWATWGQLIHAVRTGESVRKRATGSDGFGLFERDPELAAIFNMNMVQQTRLVARQVADAYPLAGVRTMVDVGGGLGALTEVFLGAAPQLQATLLERSRVIDEARAFLAQAGLAARCTFAAGDFFEAVPAGADLYVLKSIIHDWDDPRALRILRNCRAAIPDTGRLLIIERVLPERLAATAPHRSVVYADLTMMLGPGGQERTQAEFNALLDAAGFTLARTIAAGAEFSLLDASPRSARSG